MPNWCWVFWELTGTKENVKAFCEHLIFEEEANKDGITKRYFARTFAESSRDSFMEKLDEFYGNMANSKSDFAFGCNCAWSATSCLIDGYPTDEPIDKQLITLSEACKLHNVKAELSTEEPGMGFEEHIICEADGTISTNETFDLEEEDEVD